MPLPLNYKNFQGAYWLKIFSHDVSNHVEFDNKEEALFVVDQKDKFSILSQINQRDKVFHNSYEFLLEYEQSKYYIRWRQDENPLEINENDQKSNQVAGLTNISSNIDHSIFGGLALTQRDPCIPSLLSGNLNSVDWFFAIGMYKDCNGGWNHETIPGPSPSMKTKQTDLWIRIKHILTCQKDVQIRKCVSQLIIYVFIFIK